MLYDVLILGAGASGLAAASRGLPGWCLAEKNSEPAKKLYATGNGRCNYMNLHAPENALAGSAEALRAGLEALGIVGREEEEGRMYPRSGRAEDVACALIYGAKRCGTDIVCGFDAVSAVRENGVFTVTSREGRVLQAGKLLIACGGKAGIQYGCEGGGMRIAASFGHRVIKPIPALTTLLCEDNMALIAGVRVKAKVSLLKGRDNMVAPVMQDRGELLFGKNGLSGICIMNLSRAYRIEPDTEYYVVADIMEEYSLEQLKALLAERCARFAQEDASFLLSSLIPSKLSDHILSLVGIGIGRTCGSLSERERLMIAASCKLLRFTICGSGGWKEAQVTCGGVDLAEVDPDTMESKLIPGLYFSGEVLNYDGPCGGYNLGWAFSTGFAAAEAMKK